MELFVHPIFLFVACFLIISHEDPVSMITKPMSAAIAAGNAVVIKPSEVSSNVSACFTKLIPKYMDTKAIVCIEGAVEETTALLKCHFDYIFYTGNPEVGKVIMRAAANHLTPVTLELGGKSPTYVDKDVGSYLQTFANRVAWAKTLNCGQTCIACDYLLVHKDIKDEFVAKLKSALINFFGSTSDQIQGSSSYSRIINERHTKRILGLLEGQESKIIHGGKSDVKDRFIEPTLVMEPPRESKLMQEEIFGPLLPILVVNDHNEAIEYINSKPKPLALYIFSTNTKVCEDFTQRTSSGSVVYNDCILQHVDTSLPFGGVGNSGLGVGYNGKFGFDTFTHKKPLLDRRGLGTLLDVPARYAPYDNSKVTMLKLVTGKHLNLKAVFNYMAIATVAAVAVYLYKTNFLDK